MTTFEGGLTAADELLMGQFESEDYNVATRLTVSDNATFDDLCEIEPALLDIEAEILAIPGANDPGFCANAVWYEHFKPHLSKLVGWEARRPELRTEEAYDTAYEHLYDLLPPCQHDDSICAFAMGTEA